MRLAAETLTALPGTVQTIHLYQNPVRACVGCGVCDTTPLCPIPDPMPEYRQLLEQSDIILLASPLHFVSMTAPIIAFLARLQPYWRAQADGRPLLGDKKRAGGLLVTGGSHYKKMFDPARAVAAAVINSLTIPFAGMATAADTDSIKVADNPDALREARQLGETLAATVSSD